MKSGTTYLHELISSHPDIFMSEIKEPCFFLDGEELKKLAPQMWNMGIWSNTQKYLHLFKDVQKEKIIGESTTLYAKYPTISGVPKRIFEFNPEARFIYVMRDPVERTISHYWHNVRVTAKMDDILRTLQTEPHYQNVSYYAMQLKEYLKYFNLHCFYICTFEKLIKNSEVVVKDIFKWLNIDANIEIPGLNEPKNVAPGSIKISKTNMLSYQTRMSPLARRLMKYVPYKVQQIFSGFFNRSVKKDLSNIDVLLDYLRPTQRRQTEELEALLDMKFPEWSTLNP